MPAVPLPFDTSTPRRPCDAGSTATIGFAAIGLGTTSSKALGPMETSRTESASSAVLMTEGLAGCAGADTASNVAGAAVAASASAGPGDWLFNAISRFEL